MATGDDPSSDDPVAVIHDQEVITIVHADNGVKARARAPPAPSRVQLQLHVGRFLPSNKLAASRTQL